MGIVIVAAAFVLATCVLACLADAAFRDQARLPMQWWITGEVTWSAPRRLALAFMPALATVLLGVVAVSALTVPARAGQEGQVLPTAIGMGVMLVAIQLLHFWLIARTMRRGAG